MRPPAVAHAVAVGFEAAVCMAAAHVVCGSGPGGGSGGGSDGCGGSSGTRIGNNSHSGSGSGMRHRQPVWCSRCLGTPLQR